MSNRRILQDLSPPRSTDEWTGWDKRDLLDRWFTAPEAFTLGVTRIETDVAIDRIAREIGRSRNAVVRMLWYLLTYYLETGKDGKVKRHPATWFVKDEPSVLDTKRGRHPNAREEFAWLILKGRHRKVKRQGGEEVKELKDYICNWVLRLEQDRLDDLARKHPSFKPKGLF